MTEVDTSARGRLLDRIVDYGSKHGLAEHSLRTIASGVGSSHRMLIHHFGSRDEMLVSVVQEVERRQLVALAELGDGELLWERLSDPSMAPLERLFFELYAKALLGAPWGERFLDGIVDSWVDPVAAMLELDGLAPEVARARARLGLAATRGLLLDLLATGDRDGVDAAAAELARLLG